MRAKYCVRLEIRSLTSTMHLTNRAKIKLKFALVSVNGRREKREKSNLSDEEKALQIANYRLQTLSKKNISLFRYFTSNTC